MTTYIERLAEATAAHVPGVRVEPVYDSLRFARGNARCMGFTRYGKDKRRAVTDEDVRYVIRIAGNRLASDIPHYKPEFVQPARELLTILREAAD